ncbi:MAG: hypothetical protein JWR24_3066 [Actinoallomurus sp.]|jgi:hypothetical protein|nr:hypothetical protein [Actinoallomurus sp.]
MLNRIDDEHAAKVAGHWPAGHLAAVDELLGLAVAGTSARDTLGLTI